MLIYSVCVGCFGVLPAHQKDKTYWTCGKHVAVLSIGLYIFRAFDTKIIILREAAKVLFLMAWSLRGGKKKQLFKSYFKT